MLFSSLIGQDKSEEIRQILYYIQKTFFQNIQI